MTRKRTREAPEIGEFMGRMTRALVRRATEGETEALIVLRDLRDQVDAALLAAVAGAHDEFGYAYSYIGAELGVTRQAAQKMGETHKRRAAR